MAAEIALASRRRMQLPNSLQRLTWRRRNGRYGRTSGTEPFQSYENPCAAMGLGGRSIDHGLTDNENWPLLRAASGLKLTNPEVTRVFIGQRRGEQQP
jgi:hypothetical protein